MKSDRLEFMDKDVPTLKKDFRLRVLFAFMFVAAFVWQLVMLIVTPGDATTLMIILSCVTMLFSVMFGFVSIIYAIKDMRILEKIKHRGKSVNKANFVFNIEKRSFINLYSFITSLLAVVALLLLVASITYSILEIVYYNTISFYLPMIFAFTLWCFNSSYHIKNEIYLSQNVNRITSMFY